VHSKIRDTIYFKETKTEVQNINEN